MTPKEADEKVNRQHSELEQKAAERIAHLENRIRQLEDSEYKFHKAFQASAAGITITRLSDSTYLEVNDAFVQMTGYYKDELVGRSSKDLGLVANIKDREEVLQQVRKFGFARSFEMTVNHRSGKTFEVLSSIETIDLQGEKFAINIIYDITERKRTEEQLRKSNELFSRLFEHNPTSLAISRISDSKIVNVNAAFLELFEFTSKDEVIGQTGLELGIWFDRGQREEMLKLLNDNGIVQNFQRRVKISVGGIKWVSSSIIPIEVDGQACLLAVTLDISMIKKAEEQMRLMNKELEAFSYSVSHDLRAPLRSLAGYSKILEEDHIDKLGDDGKKVLQSIIRNTGKMNNLIEDLLEFSKFGKQELKKVALDSEKLVQGIVADLSGSTQHKASVTLNSLSKVYADKTLLSQVWSNLISNAIKYSGKKEKPTIEIGSREEENEIIFYVRDNGAGFDMDYVHKLFAVFQRLHGPNEFEGTGVGLALVQRIIARHGGRVWAEGKVNEGATFYFTLPS